MVNTEAVYFYIYALILIVSAVGVVFSPRMFLSFCAFFCTLLFSSCIYGLLNAGFMALFQFILCGLFLCIMLMLILKKITIWTLPLKVASVRKIVLSSVALVIFGIFSYLYVSFEFGGVIGEFFDFIKEKSVDIVDFSDFMFSIHLVIIITLVMCVMLRNIYLTKNNTEETDD